MPRKRQPRSENDMLGSSSLLFLFISSLQVVGGGGIFVCFKPPGFESEKTQLAPHTCTQAKYSMFLEC